MSPGPKRPEVAASCFRNWLGRGSLRRSDILRPIVSVFRADGAHVRGYCVGRCPPDGVRAGVYIGCRCDRGSARSAPAVVMAYFRPGHSADALAPALSSFRMPTIWVSLNRDFRMWVSFEAWPQKSTYQRRHSRGYRHPTEVFDLTASLKREFLRSERCDSGHHRSTHSIALGADATLATRASLALPAGK